jgi:hypothetical protein
MPVDSSLRQQLGVLVYDIPRILGLVLRHGQKSPHPFWVELCNRNEKVVHADGSPGVKCDWQWTSKLHFAKVFPFLGQWLYRQALADFPIALAPEPRWNAESHDTQVTFIIGHRGAQRIPHLLLTLQSIAAQIDISAECIVIEQDAVARLRTCLPRWVRYRHTPPPRPDMPYARSWAFNVGARLARGNCLVCHDNDMLIPNMYGAHILARMAAGYDAVNLKRFIFYLDEGGLSQIEESQKVESGGPIKAVLQNLEAGGSVAVSRETYFRIGGFDEAFIGWGGEDNEFWERTQRLRVWPFGYLPIVHLHHTDQPEKIDPQMRGRRLYLKRAAIPTDRRIQELSQRDFGNPHQLDPPFSPGDQSAGGR